MTNSDIQNHEGLLTALPLTKIDRDIIAHLQQDGRRPFVTIAAEIGVTEKTVRAHVKTLLDRQIIQIVALTSPGALGYSVMALAAISIDEPASGSRIADALARIDTIDYVVLSYGRYAIFAEIVARDMHELHTTIETKIGAIRGITGIELFPYFSLYYQQARITDIAGPMEDEGAGVRDAELSDIDKAIASELNMDGRAPFGSIAERLSISESQVRQRVLNMTAARQLRIMAIVNPLKLLKFTMAWIAIKVQPESRLTDVADALAVMPNVSYVTICAGRFDIFAELICTSQKALFDMIEQRVRPLEGVRDTEAFIYANLHYKRLLPVHVRDRTGEANAPVHSFHTT